MQAASWLQRSFAGLGRSRARSLYSVNSSAGRRCVATAMAPQFSVMYFDIEGAGEPIRLAASLAGIEYEDKRVSYGEWGEMKQKMPNGQLPVMTIPGDDRMYPQCIAILKKIEKWSGDVLTPAPGNEYDVDEALALFGDCQMAWAPSLYIGMNPAKFGYPDGFAKTPEGEAKKLEMRAKFVAEILPKLLDSITILLDRHGGDAFLAGPKPTIADCRMFPWLRGFTRGHVDGVPTDALESHPKVVAYMHRFAKLPGVQGRYKDGIRYPMD